MACIVSIARRSVAVLAARASYLFIVRGGTMRARPICPMATRIPSITSRIVLGHRRCPGGGVGDCGGPGSTTPVEIRKIVQLAAMYEGDRKSVGVGKRGSGRVSLRGR